MKVNSFQKIVINYFHNHFQRTRSNEDTAVNSLNLSLSLSCQGDQGKGSINPDKIPALKVEVPLGSLLPECKKTWDSCFI